MSVVVARRYKECIELGTDSAATFDDLVIKDNKLIENGHLFCGVAGLSENATLWEMYIESEPLPGNSKRDMFQYKLGFVQRFSEISDTLDDMHILLIYGDKIWFIDGLSVNEIREYHAIGSGSPVALGALHMGASVTEAIEAACLYNTGCALPANVRTLTFESPVVMLPTGMFYLEG